MNHFAVCISMSFNAFFIFVKNMLGSCDLLNSIVFLYRSLKNCRGSTTLSIVLVYEVKCVFSRYTSEVFFSGEEYVNQMWTYIAPELLSSIEREPEEAVVPEMMESFAKVNFSLKRSVQQVHNIKIFFKKHFLRSLFIKTNHKYFFNYLVY